VSHAQYSVFSFVCPLFAITACIASCSPPSIRGALAGSADALEARDPERLFTYLDERSRFALAGTVKARLASRHLIEADYPEPEKTAALAALGDAAQVETGAQLFARRCDSACLVSLTDRVGAPISETPVGDEVIVKTTRGGTLHMHAGNDGGYGIVWNTQALSDERSQAARDLGQIKGNAEVYRKRRQLSAKR
jgi:hypothetical protein